jgi:hypothetical protein
MEAEADSMKQKRLGAVFWAGVGLVCAASAAGVDVVARDEFREGLAAWVVEQQSGGTVEAKDGVLTITDRAGCTVWWRQRLEAPLLIRYTATMKSDARVSDLNCFWMAVDLRNPDDLFAAGHGRDGRFGTYDGLATYYVGCGGNVNTTTRFRRYDGRGARPLLPQHDLTEPAALLEAERAYRIEIRVGADGRTTWARDGVVWFTHIDPEPLRSGWFGFRTVDSRIEIRDFVIERL